MKCIMKTGERARVADLTPLYDLAIVKWKCETGDETPEIDLVSYQIHIVVCFFTTLIITKYIISGLIRKQKLYKK